MKSFNKILLTLLIATILSPNHLDAQHLVARPVRNDSLFRAPYCYEFNQYCVNDSLKKQNQFAKPQKIKVYPGELFEVKEGFFVWRDSMLLNAICDTFFYGGSPRTIRAISKDGKRAVIDKNMGKPNHWQEWIKPRNNQTQSIFGNDSICDISSISVNPKESSQPHFKISYIRNEKKVEIVVPKSTEKRQFDSCLIINETHDFDLCVVLHPGDSLRFSLDTLGLTAENDTCVFRIHPSGMLPTYFNYPADIIEIQSQGPSIWTRMKNALSEVWWIGWLLFIIVVIASIVVWIIVKRNGTNNKSCTIGEKKAEDLIEMLKKHLQVIDKEYMDMSTIIENKDSTDNPTNTQPEFEIERKGKRKGKGKEKKEGNTQDKKNIELDDSIVSLFEKLGESIETLTSSIEGKYQETLQLKATIEERESLLNDTIQKEKEKIEQEANNKVAEVQEELKNEKANTAQKVKDAEDIIKKDLAKVQEELKNEKANTAQKVKEAEDKVKKDLAKVQEELRTEKNSTAQKVQKAREEEQEEKRKAVQLKDNVITQLKLDQKFYLDNFTRMEFAQPYATLLKQLISVTNEVEKAANALMEGDKLDDAYYLYRAQAKYNLNLSKIDKPAFLSEIEMIAKGQLVFNSSAATKYDPKDKEDSIKKYFFSNYLEKYFNALVVFNETLSGLYLFDQKIKEKDVTTFTNLRAKINDIAAKLGIEIATLHLGEQNKYADVQILDRVDMGLPKNTIVDIENCKVSVKGGRSSADKIKIKVQL